MFCRVKENDQERPNCFFGKEGRDVSEGSGDLY